MQFLKMHIILSILQNIPNNLQLRWQLHIYISCPGYSDLYCYWRRYTASLIPAGKFFALNIIKIKLEKQAVFNHWKELEKFWKKTRYHAWIHRISWERVHDFFEGDEFGGENFLKITLVSQFYAYYTLNNLVCYTILW